MPTQTQASTSPSPHYTNTSTNMNSITAFATPTPVAGLVSPTTSASTCRQTVPRAALNGDKRVFSNNLNNKTTVEIARPARDAEFRGPQGWTPYAEKVNGRLAQLGFVIGLVTEIVSGKPISEQILVMFSPLVATANELTVLGAQAAHLGQHLN